jgi:ATP-dependent exoDNAse (exonuclease V) alpha subunit
LPPISGQGAFTRRAPDFLLTEIHRQAADSPIIRLATMARRGEPIAPGDYGDGVLVEELNPETMEAIHRPDTQVVCGLHKTRWTTTQRIRARLGFEGRVPIEGERVICRRNNRTLAIFNGQQGHLLESAEVVTDRFVMSVKMDDLPVPLRHVRIHPYLFDQHFDGPSQRPRVERGVDEFDWGYVLTVHSAQGSEWPHVTVIDDSPAFKGDRHKHLYTALTRASEGLTLLQRTASVRPRRSVQARIAETAPSPRESALRATREAATIVPTSAGAPAAVRIDNSGDDGTAPTATASDSLVCYWCRGRRFWRSIYGLCICDTCHPPAAPVLVAAWIEPSPRDESGDEEPAR